MIRKIRHQLAASAARDIETENPEDRCSVEGSGTG